MSFATLIKADATLPRKPLCSRCGVAEGKVICGFHKQVLCLACQGEHHTDLCYYNAAPAVHLMQVRHAQLSLTFEEAQP